MSLATMTQQAYTIHGPSTDTSREPPCRSPSIRREPKLSNDNLRILYRSSASPSQVSPQSNSASVTIAPTTPILPPTPPHGDDDEQDYHEAPSPEGNKVRSMLVTPVNQHSPPTPEITPPRDHQYARAKPFLGAQPSMTSTRAESFKTAHEEMPSEAESDFTMPMPRYGLGLGDSPRLTPLQQDHKPSPLVQMTGLDGTMDSPTLQPFTAIAPIHEAVTIESQDQMYEDSPILPSQIFQDHTALQQYQSPQQKRGHRRGLSLRDRLEESKVIPRSRSVDKFANIIGWNDNVQVEDEGQLFDISNAKIGAIVVDKPRSQTRRGTLRHVSKTDSLRSVSSPLPNSNQDTAPLIQSNGGSPHKLVHKKGKVTNQNRLSFGSENSRSLSIGSSAPVGRMEIIKVAVIPERLSSLTTPERGKQHSESTSSASIPLRPRRGSEGAHAQWSKQRTSSDATRGRDRYYPPPVGPHTVPPRSSSLSAPTSRETSRANSLTSENLRFERKRAEKELRTTLHRMESERLASSLKSNSAEKVIVPASFELMTSASQIDVRAHDFAANVEPFPEHIMPGTKEWADLRPPSILTTPFSAPSFLSASPEISEAKIINFFPHNNHSLQLIEPLPILESRAVRTFRRQDQSRLHNDSPFRDPRAAPQPPAVQSIATHPRTENFSQLIDSPQRHGGATEKRPVIGQQDRADSFAKALIRTVSLKHARNKKAHQDLDSTSNPMWRPRPFWDDADVKQPGPPATEQQDRGIVQNSVGIPLQRNIFSGPIGLMHRLSIRRRDRKVAAKQPSYTSLRRIQAGRKIYRLPGLGVHLHLINLGDVQEKIARSRRRRENDRRERRREELRRSIGPNVIPTGDSRFPVTVG